MNQLECVPLRKTSHVPHVVLSLEEGLEGLEEERWAKLTKDPASWAMADINSKKVMLKMRLACS